MNFKLHSLLLSVAVLLLGIGFAEAKGPVYSKPVTKKFIFNSTPAGAKVYHEGRLICPSTPGEAYITCKGVITPDKKDMATALQQASYNSRQTFTFVKAGYLKREVNIEPTVTPERKNILKSNYHFDWRTNVECELQRDPKTVETSYTKDPTIRRGEAKKTVTRDNPGGTALERTIIRWYFESQPQGARIFWRVISSCPDQVKNTNELWLGNTPFEETRSFNIQGLSYENARDVQIEIKVRRSGYLDQTKRFNVRQAIDQQEISSFFEMVKAEN